MLWTAYAGSTFQNLQGTAAPLLSIQRNSSVLFEDCTLQDIANTEVNGSAVQTGFVKDLIPSAVLVRRCNITNVTDPFFEVSSRAAVFYSDEKLVVYDNVQKQSSTTETVDRAQSGAGAAFLRAQDRPTFPPDEAEVRVHLSTNTRL